MAIVRVTGGGGGLERRVGITAAKKAAKKGAKKGAKHAMEKHPAKKHAIDKHAGKKAAKEAAKKAAKKAPAKKAPVKVTALEVDSQRDLGSLLTRAFHHLQRASAVISLLEKDSGSDLRSLLDQGVAVYRQATKNSDEKRAAQARGILSAAEHMGLAGLYSARIDFRVDVSAPPQGSLEEHLRILRGRLETLGRPPRHQAELLLGAAWELLRRSDAAGDDPHLEWELAMAAEGLCAALENGF